MEKTHYEKHKLLEIPEIGKCKKWDDNFHIYIDDLINFILYFALQNFKYTLIKRISIKVPLFLDIIHLITLISTSLAQLRSSRTKLVLKINSSKRTFLFPCVVCSLEVYFSSGDNICNSKIGLDLIWMFERSTVSLSRTKIFKN